MERPGKARSVSIVVLTTLGAFGLARYAGWAIAATEVGAGYWPAAGLVVGSLLLLERRWWPVLIAAVVTTQFVGDVVTGTSVVPALLWGTANAVGHASMAALIQAWGAQRLVDATSVLRFFGACILGGLVAGLIGAVGTLLGGFATSYTVAALSWAVGDAAGALTVAPLVLALAGRFPPPAVPVWEMVAAGTVPLALAAVAFLNVAALPLAFLPSIGLVWVGARLGMGLTAAAIAVIAQLAFVGTALGLGPFGADLQAGERSLVLHLFFASTVAVGVLLASRSVERSAYLDMARERDLLLAAVSHELRTPLTPIVGFSELTLRRDGGLSPQAREAFEVISRNGQHLTTLIDNLLQATRLDRGQVQPDPDQVDVVRLLDELCRSRAEHAIEVVGGDAALLVRFDREHLVQIVANLLDNAVNHGEPPVMVRLRAADGEARIEVTDQGPGVPSWFVPRLFDVFAQATDGDRRASTGLGLGLPIAQDLARLNGGDLRYEPDERGRSRFVVIAPTDQVPASPAIAGASLPDPTGAGADDAGEAR
ncbi:MAG: MASE1 domain-containing protein [Nitriliruptoraceae bacterium]|nr:MASE1 domain-containing protein [Nitriliruptoraceae bacterium]